MDGPNGSSGPTSLLGRDIEERALILAPLGRDAAIAAMLLGQGGMSGFTCPDLPELVTELARGAGLVLITQEAIVTADLHALSAWISEQPAWSDLAFVVVTERGGGPERNPGAQRLAETLGNITLLERPFHPVTLLSVARAALRSRRRQYQARTQLDALGRQNAALEESEQKFRTLAENLPNLCWMAGADGSIYWYNPGWYRYTGTTPAEMEGWGWQSVHDQAVLPLVMQRWTGCIAAGVPFDMTFPLRGADNVFRPFLTRVVPLRNDAGEILRWFGTNVDVSEQQRIEQALRDSEERLRVAQTAGGVGTFEWFPETGKLDVSDEYRRIWGLPPTVTVTRDLLLSLIHPEDRGQTGPNRRGTVGNPVGYAEYRVTRPDTGEERWIARRGEAVAITPASDGAAPKLRIVGVAFDVTDRRGIEAALAESEMLFRSTFEQAAVGIAHVALDGRWLRVNERLCAMLGYSEAELQGIGFQEVTYPDDLRADLDNVAAMLAGEISTYKMEKRYVRKSGEVFWINLTVSMLLDDVGASKHFVSVVEDISARKAIEADLADSRARLQAILDTVPVSIVFAEAPSGRLIFGNAGVQRVFRYPMRPSNEIAEYRDWEAYHADGRRVAAHEFPLATALTAGEASHGEFQFECGDGVRRWIGVSGAPIRDDAGAITGAVVVCADVDDLRQAEIVLSRDKQDLERLVAERTLELEAAQARLAHAQRMEALGQLAGGIAHDFNNVVQAVQGGARLIERRATDAERVRSLARMIAESAARGAAITRRLLSFSRRGDLRAETVEVAALLRGLREILVHTLGAGIKIRVEVERGLPPLLADKGQLETVLVNLATNARDALAGAGTLAFAAALEVLPDVVEPGHPITLAPGSYVRLSVADNGTGMTQEVLARASEPFFTTKDVGVGTGLGLAMARGFTEQSGGGLHIESALGRGTVVKLWFPVSADVVRSPPPPVPRHEAAAARPGAARARLLMVDDERIVRETLSQQMQDEGFAVVVAASGTEALAKLDEEAEFDLVIADLSMPGMDGLTLLKEIYRKKPRLPAILLTGFATDAAEVAISGAMGGRFALLRKPVEASVLAERVAVMLEGIGVGAG